MLGGDGGLRLHAFYARQRGALPYMVAFLHIKVSNAAEGGCADVDVGLWLDLAGSADDRGKVLSSHLPGRHLGELGVVMKDQARRHAGCDEEDDDDKDDLFEAHSDFLGVFRASFA